MCRPMPADGPSALRALCLRAVGGRRLLLDIVHWTARYKRAARPPGERTRLSSTMKTIALAALLSVASATHIAVPQVDVVGRREVVAVPVSGAEFQPFTRSSAELTYDALAPLRKVAKPIVYRSSLALSPVEREFIPVEADLPLSTRRFTTVPVDDLLTSRKFTTVPINSEFYPTRKFALSDSSEFYPTRRFTLSDNGEFYPTKKFATVPVSSDFISTKKFIPYEKEYIPLEKEFIPAEKEFIPFEREFVPIEKEFIPVERELLNNRRVVPHFKSAVSLDSGIIVN